MTRTSRFLGAVAAVATASTLGFAGVAGASAGQRTYQQTYPRASSLCAAVLGGAGPKRLRPVVAQVLADCTTLQNGFNAAQAAVLAADASIAATLAAQRTTVKGLCAGLKPHTVACHRARHKEKHMAGVMAHRRIHLAQVYYKTIEANRRAFWREIDALPGGANVRADLPIPVQSS
jgi:hypothetical protein